MKIDDKLYTSSQVAQILGVSLRSVYRYLDEGKLDAEVKTATGRHRFSRQNILDFLYPTGEQKNQLEENNDEMVDMSAFLNKKKKTVVENPTNIAKKESPVEPEIKEEEKPQEIEEEPVDWLAKFREAAAKFKEEQKPESSNVVEEEISKPVAPVLETAVEDEEPEKIAEDDFFAQIFSTKNKESENTTELKYYRSMLGGLKDIAQTLDKSGKENGSEYAFTLNAGLSLHKPIKPFAMLHAYINRSDVDFFEKSLRLTPSDESTSQLCLLCTSNDAIFSEKEEQHGLYVVSKSQLKDDIDKYGTISLREEAEQVLNG